MDDYYLQEPVHCWRRDGRSFFVGCAGVIVVRGLKFHSDGHINFVVGVGGEPCNLGTGAKSDKSGEWT
jgi:hypothetical protein